MTNQILGYGTVAIAIICFGSNFIPLKKFETGDGMFFQWIMAIAIWICGLVTYLIIGSPEFYPLAMLGGVLWATGNILTVPIVKLIGMGLGLMLWGLSNLITGWAIANYGLFGTDKEAPEGTKAEVFNYLGVAFCVISFIPYAFMKPNELKIRGESETEKFIEGIINHPLEEIEESLLLRYLAKLSPLTKRLLGVFLAIVAGIFYGANFTPPTYVIDHDCPTCPQINFCFPHFCGILLASTTYLTIYCICSWNNPSVNNNIILPGFFAGVGWGLAQISWFIANSNLSQVVTFPLISSGPGIVGCLWGILVFKEFTGARNYGMFLFALCITLIGIVFITLSKYFGDQASG